MKKWGQFNFFINIIAVKLCLLNDKFEGLIAWQIKHNSSSTVEPFLKGMNC